MPAIITVTFSPCIDKSTSVASLVPDKKLRCAAPKLEPGGGGINVARVIKRLGGDVLALYPSGGYSGKYLDELLINEDVPIMPVRSIHETRENFMITEETGNKQYRFIMPGTMLLEKEWNASLGTLEELKNVEYIILSGSMPPGSPADLLAKMTNIAVKLGAKLIVDSSGNALSDAIREGVYLIKPNLAELAALTGREWIMISDVELIARELIRNSKCSVVAVSLGKDGAILVTNDQAWKITAPVVERKSTVGAGDSMVAGIVYSLSIGMRFDQALAYGVACGTAATMNPGTELCKKADADRLYSQIFA